ncbi:MAG: bifunctional riboflavin kinase/FAD synthetase [Peptococcaceae bacterium]|nr:bifunctional riboflavin kinase/FAD synthetase [Peptococcaceae bacterium]
MKICNVEPGKNYEPTVIALGNFDGVHLGHQKLLRCGLEKAQELGVDFSVFLFYPHPLKILYPERKLNLLTEHEERLKILEELGVNKVFVVPFTVQLAYTSPEDFVKNILLQIGAVHVVVGFNYSFGFQGKGDPELLKTLAEKYDFQVSVIHAQKLGSKVISSSEIRKYLLEGEIDLATKMMGRSPSICGRVIHGDERGRTLGFPTANIEVDEDLLVPKNGVYAVESEINGLRYGGMMNIGLRPTFKKESERTIEVHFFDFQGDLYGQKIMVKIKSKLRSEKKFQGPEEIISQLHKDRQQALYVLQQ